MASYSFLIINYTFPLKIVEKYFIDEKKKVYQVKKIFIIKTIEGENGMSLNLREIFDRNYLKGYLHRNKKIYLVSIILFVILGSVGTLTGSDTMNIDFDKNLEESVQSNGYSEILYDNTFTGFLLLFLHNFMLDFTSIIGGLFLFVPTLYLAFINATNFITLFVKSDPLMLLLGVLPHGIFEIPSSIVAMAGGLMLFITEINIIRAVFTGKGVRNAINDSQTLIKDALISIMIVFVLLITAAFIETFITVALLVNFY